MYYYPVCEDEITKIIAKFKNDKSPVPDNITAKLLTTSLLPQRGRAMLRVRQ